MSKNKGRRTRTSKATSKAPDLDPASVERAAREKEFLTMVTVLGFSITYPREADAPDKCDSSLEEYERVVFREGDDVILNSDFDKTEDVWVGQISEVRTSQDRSDVLVKVRWYWSRNNIAGSMKSFDLNQCAPYERILSDDYDYNSPYAFDVTYVHEYDERALKSPSIGPEDFFLRTTLLSKGSRKQIKPSLGADNCLCQQAYNPYPAPVTESLDGKAQLSSSPNVMHFCPSLECRKWYHASCLTTMGHIDQTSPPNTRGLRLLAADPDHEVPFATFAYFSEQESAQDILSDDQVTVHHALEMFGRSPSILLQLPSGLLAIAQCPIVRASGASNGWAIGNVADVVLARRFVYTVIEHNGLPQHSSPEYLELLRRDFERTQLREELFWSASKDTDMTLMDEIDALEQLCEDLGKFDLLAEPYAPYWERIEREYMEAEVMLSDSAFVCPKCCGAI